MKKSTKFLLISAGALIVGISAYLTLRPRRVEDNGLETDDAAEINALTELDNTTGSNKIEVGDTIYPSGAYVNVRYGAFVNNGLINNIMVVINSPTAVGEVLEILPSDNHTWYRVYVNINEYVEIGYVRADVVTKNI